VVVLLGDSLFLDGLEASLADVHDLCVFRIHNWYVDGGRQLCSLCPDLVVFELAARHLPSVISCLTELPDVPLIGLDLNRSQAVALTGHHHTTRTASELANVIRMYTSDSGDYGSLGPTSTSLITPDRPTVGTLH
jgi:hypothetical protein